MEVKTLENPLNFSVSVPIFLRMSTASHTRKFIGALFLPCNVYGRVYLNKEGNAYLGNCPKCGKPVRVRAEPGGAKINMVQVVCSTYRY